MSEAYNYILAELIKRTTKLHGEALNERGQKVDWPAITVKITSKEIQASPYKSDTKLKAISGQVWGWLRGQYLSTRHIYQLLVQWALYLTNEGLLCTYTTEYADLLEELMITIEAGAEGEVSDINPEEILEEWKFMQENYYSLLHNLCNKLIGDYVNERN